MIGDKVYIEHVENGFMLNLNEYCADKDRRKMKLVARTEDELYKIIRDKVFPVESPEQCTIVRGPGNRCTLPFSHEGKCSFLHTDD